MAEQQLDSKAIDDKALNSKWVLAVPLNFKGVFAHEKLIQVVSLEDLRSCCHNVDAALDHFLREPGNEVARSELRSTMLALQSCTYLWGRHLETALLAYPENATSDLISTAFDAGGRLVQLRKNLFPEQEIAADRENEKPLPPKLSAEALRLTLDDFQKRILRRLLVMPEEWEFLRSHLPLAA